MQKDKEEFKIDFCIFSCYKLQKSKIFCTFAVSNQLINQLREVDSVTRGCNKVNRCIEMVKSRFCYQFQGVTKKIVTD